MRLKASESQVHIPGNLTTTRRIIAEWVCPDCDYYEEAEDELA
jgi:hypothetical protein